MNNTLEQVNFIVKIELDNNKAVFNYFKDGKPSTGGGVVRTETAGIYTLHEESIKNEFTFIAPTITNKVGNCAQDFSHELSDGGQTITIKDTNENNGTVCLIFNVTRNGITYHSTDPQIKNEDEN